MLFRSSGTFWKQNHNPLLSLIEHCCQQRLFKMRWKSDWYNYILCLPFILIPFLITNHFFDPSLLIKRTGVYFLCMAMALVLAFSKRHNNIGKIHLLWIIAFACLILFIVLTSIFSAVNSSDALWSVVFLVGWSGVYFLFMLYSTTEAMKYIIYGSSVVWRLV